MVDYVKDDTEKSATDLSVVVGPEKTVTFAIDDDLGDMISVQVGSATFGVEGVFYISGSFGFVKRTDTVTVITGLTADMVKDNAALKDGLGHVTGVSEDYSQITDMPVNALLLGGSNVTISVGGAPDEALFSIGQISFGLGLFSSQESSVVPTLYALYARKDITHVPGQHDLDLGLLMIDLDAIIFRLNGGGTWTGTTASAYIDFAGNTVDVPTGGTPVTLAYSTAVIGVELINPALNVADFVVISADSLLIEHRTGQVDVVTGLTSTTVGSAAKRLGPDPKCNDQLRLFADHEFAGQYQCLCGRKCKYLYWGDEQRGRPDQSGTHFLRIGDRHLYQAGRSGSRRADDGRARRKLG